MSDYLLPEQIRDIKYHYTEIMKYMDLIKHGVLNNDHKMIKAAAPFINREARNLSKCADGSFTSHYYR